MLIEGKIKTNKYTDKNGVEKESWDLRADSMQMLGGKGERSESAPAQRSSQGAGPVADDFDDEIPFAPISNKLSMVL